MIMLVPIIVGLNQSFKQIIENKYIPILSVVLGILLSVAFGGVSADRVVEGMAIGLSACGLYDQKKWMN